MTLRLPILKIPRPPEEMIVLSKTWLSSDENSKGPKLTPLRLIPELPVLTIVLPLMIFLSAPKVIRPISATSAMKLLMIVLSFESVPMAPMLIPVPTE